MTVFFSQAANSASNSASRTPASIPSPRSPCATWALIFTPQPERCWENVSQSMTQTLTFFSILHGIKRRSFLWPTGKVLWLPHVPQHSLLRPRQPPTSCCSTVPSTFPPQGFGTSRHCQKHPFLALCLAHYFTPTSSPLTQHPQSQPQTNLPKTPTSCHSLPFTRFLKFL